MQYRNDMVVELQAKRDLLYHESKEMPLVKIWRTPASFYSFWDVHACFGRQTRAGRTLKTSDDVAEYLLNHAGVITASGTGFMQDGYLRLSFATPNEHIIEGSAPRGKR